MFARKGILFISLGFIIISSNIFASENSLESKRETKSKQVNKHHRFRSFDEMKLKERHNDWMKTSTSNTQTDCYSHDPLRSSFVTTICEVVANPPTLGVDPRHWAFYWPSSSRPLPMQLSQPPVLLYIITCHSQAVSMEARAALNLEPA